jgi:hypothetical protein
MAVNDEKCWLIDLFSSYYFIYTEFGFPAFHFDSCIELISYLLPFTDNFASGIMAYIYKHMINMIIHLFGQSDCS